MRTLFGLAALTAAIVATAGAQVDTSRSIRPNWRRVGLSTDRAFLIRPPRAIAFTPNAFALAKSTVRLVPAGSPNPHRYFGPFHSGSHIDAIRLLIDGGVPAWYFTDYLTVHPTTKIRSYFPAGFTAQSALPAGPRHIPGTVPQRDGLHDLSLSLQQLSYSGRYGGSVELTFVADETFEYDARSGTVAWDFADLTLRVYVVPSNVRFNANPATVGTEPIFIEISPTLAATYEVDPNNRPVGIDTVDRSAALEALWVTLRGQIAASAGLSFRRAAAAFVYGYIHDLFSDRLTGANVVSQLLLDEGFLDLDVRTGTPYVYAAFRMSALEEPDVGDDLEATISGCQVDGATGDSYCGARTRELRGQQTTPSYVLAIFPLSQCNMNTHLMFQVRIREVDLVFDDDYETDYVFQQVDCAVLNGLANQQRWGSSDIYRAENIVLRDNDNAVSGLVSVEVRLTLENR